MAVTNNHKRIVRRAGLVVTIAACCIAACTPTVDGPGTSPTGTNSTEVAGTTASFKLGDDGIVSVSADVPVRTEIEVTLFEQPPTDEPLAAVLVLLPEDIVVGQSPTAKSTTRLADTGPSGNLKVRIVIGSDGFGLFDPGQDLGVIDVTVSNGEVTAVNSKLVIPKFVLTQVLSGFFTVGMELLSKFDGTIEIENMNIDFGMTEDDPNAPTERRACCFARNGPPQCLDIGFVDALRTADDCAQNLNGVALAVGTTCGELPCDSSEACCLPDGECDEMTPLDCADRSGTSQGDGTQCADLECPADADAPQDCTANNDCNVLCPDVEPDPDCSNAEICAAKEFCCVSDLICDIQRCNELDSDCTNLIFCDRFDGCCDDDDVCHTEIDGLACPQADEDCSFCSNADEVCIRGCEPADPDCTETDDCPEDDRCDIDCAGEDPDCAFCEADSLGRCVSDCTTPDPDCFVVTNITAEGTPFASSVFNDESEYLAIRATDGNSGSNWFSDGRGGDGPDADSEVFTWVRNLSGDASITRIETDPETFPGGFGFLLVQVLVLNAAETTVFDSGFLTMEAFQVDLNVPLPEGVEGNTVILTFVNHEDTSCGGFSEFRVFGLRD